MKKKNKNGLNEEFRSLKPKDKIVEDFCDYFTKITGISKEEFEEFDRKVKSGEIKLDNDLDV